MSVRDDEKLACEIQKFPCLYDKSLKSYKDHLPKKKKMHGALLMSLWVNQVAVQSTSGPSFSTGTVKNGPTLEKRMYLVRKSRMWLRPKNVWTNTSFWAG